MSKSPLQLIAGKSLLKNQGLGISQELYDLLDEYEDIDILLFYHHVLSECNITSAKPLSWPIVRTLQSSPELINAIWADHRTFFGDRNLTDAPYDWLTDLIREHVPRIIPSIPKFIDHFSTTLLLKDTVNSFIDAAEGVEKFIEPVFTSHNSLMSGNISDITTDVDNFATDLSNLGLLFDTTNIDRFLTITNLIRVMSDKGLLYILSDHLAKYGISASGLETKLLEEESISMIVQKKFYTAMQNLEGDTLRFVLDILQVNLELDYASDLLNIKKVFPNSNSSLSVFGQQSIFDSSFAGAGEKYYSILPKSVADSTEMLRQSFQQVSGIQDITSDVFIEMVGDIQLTSGLDDLSAASQPLPDDIKDYYANELGQGGGPRQRYYISDGVGSAAGIVVNEQYEKVIDKMLNEEEVRNISITMSKMIYNFYNNRGSLTSAEGVDDDHASNRVLGTYRIEMDMSMEDIDEGIPNSSWLYDAQYTIPAIIEVTVTDDGIGGTNSSVTLIEAGFGHYIKTSFDSPDPILIDNTSFDGGTTTFDNIQLYEIPDSKLGDGGAPNLRIYLRKEYIDKVPTHITYPGYYLAEGQPLHSLVDNEVDYEYNTLQGIMDDVDTLMQDHLYNDENAIYLVSEQIKGEYELLERAGIKLADYNANLRFASGSEMDVMTFIDNLHTFGADGTLRNSREVLEKFTTNDIHGKAILGVLREGANLKNIESKKSGGLDCIPDPYSPDEPGNFLNYK